MLPKEKAKELVDKMYSVDDYDDYNAPAMQYEHARKCALIAVDEILKYSKYILHWMPCNNPECGCKEYWEEVKHEIINL